MAMGSNEIKPASDGKIWAYYDVNTTESAFPLLNLSSDFSAMEVDGESKPLATSYLFPNTGVHLVKFTPKNNRIASMAWRAVGRAFEVYFPDSITQFTAAVFYSNSYIKKVVANGLQSITSQAFQSCANLTMPLNFPSLRSLGESAFHSAAFGDIINLGECTTIANNAIRGSNYNCKKAILPATLTSIGTNFLLWCYNLSEVTIKAITPPTLGSGAFTNSPIQHIYVPAESVQAYKEASGWSAYASKISAIPE